MDKCGHFDTVFCFSVLPYVNIERTLCNLSRVADVAFIEAQLKGDGPGVFEDEGELKEVLLQHWDSVDRIGETRVEIRNTIRAIWMCKGGKSCVC
jgi:hypothetical protein